MQTYETIIILKPQLSDADVSEFVDKTKKLITSEGGAIVGDDRWGRRRLAYPVKKFREGFYVLLRFSASSSVFKRLNQYFRIQENVLRTLTVKGASIEESAKKEAKT